MLFRQALADRLGINLTDLACIGLLSESGPLTAGKLAELTGLTTGAVTGMVDRLERGGYVRRENDPLDRRRVVVRAVEDKLTGLSPQFEPLREAVEGIASTYSDQELSLLLDYFSRIRPVMAEQTARLRDASAPGEGGLFSAPLESARRGRLEFRGGASQAAIRGDAGLAVLYEARFRGETPAVRVNNGTVTIRSPKFSLLSWRHRRGADIVLNATIPWEVQLRGGAWKLAADLRALTLLSLDLSGGANDLSVELPAPTGAVPVRVSGGASKVDIHRPAGAAASIRLRGGATELLFDGQRFAALGSETHVTTPNYAGSTDRYDFELTGGASKLTIDTRG